MRLVRTLLRPRKRGSIIADVGSETPAGVDEHLFFNEFSTPPLQTGVYHVALLTKSLEVEIHVALKVTIELGGEPRDSGSGERAATSEFTHTERFVGGGDELKEEERALDRGRR